MITIRKAMPVVLMIICLGICNCGGGGAGSQGGSSSPNSSGGSSTGGTEGVIDLAWDSSFDSGTAGYRVYYGTTSEKYDGNVEVTDPGAGDTVTYRLANLTRGQTYFISVTAHDSFDNESGYSNEVSGPAK